MYILLSAAVFCLFGLMFLRMSKKTLPEDQRLRGGHPPLLAFFRFESLYHNGRYDGRRDLAAVLRPGAGVFHRGILYRPGLRPVPGRPVVRDHVFQVRGLTCPPLAGTGFSINEDPVPARFQPKSQEKPRLTPRRHASHKKANPTPNASDSGAGTCGLCPDKSKIATQQRGCNFERRGKGAKQAFVNQPLAY